MICIDLSPGCWECLCLHFTDLLDFFVANGLEWVVE